MRFWLVPLFLLSFLLFPTPTFAHGFGQKFNLPLPFWLYLFSAGIVVVVSFVLLSFFTSAKKEIKPVKVIRPLPSLLILTLRVLFLILFLLLITAGWFGNQFPGDNFATIFFWIIWTVGVFYLVAFLGNLWEYLNPWNSLFLIFKWFFPNYKPPFNLPKEVGIWPAFIFLVGYLWVENVLVLFDPLSITKLLTFYTATTLAATFAFGKKWLAVGEVFTALYRVISTFSPFKFLQNKTEIFMPSIRLTNELARDFSLVAFVLFMLAGVTFDGVKETPTYFSLMQYLPNNLNINLTGLQFNTLALFGLFGLFSLVYYFFNLLVSLFTHLSLKRASLYFITSLVPIAIGYELAHFSSLILIQGQDIIRIAGDPFAFGWNLFGTESFRPVFFINAKFFWYFQISTIVLGHIAGVYVAHKIALNYLDRKKAFLSQLTMLGLMIVFTIFSLWVISQPVVIQYS